MYVYMYVCVYVHTYIPEPISGVGTHSIENTFYVYLSRHRSGNKQLSNTPVEPYREHIQYRTHFVLNIYTWAFISGVGTNNFATPLLNHHGWASPRSVTTVTKGTRRPLMTWVEVARGADCSMGRNRTHSSEKKYKQKFDFDGITKETY
jgi:hypothetical protein